jgi:hypothetical protein
VLIERSQIKNGHIPYDSTYIDVLKKTNNKKMSDDWRAGTGEVEVWIEV